jgi:predicted MarR family transcription regulator
MPDKSKRQPDPKPPRSRRGAPVARREPEELDTHWHLSRDDRETGITEVEFSLMRISAAYERWIAECLDRVAGAPLGSAASMVLHVIGLKDRPKTPAEIARLLNRDDTANVLYSIRKLERAGLVERAAAPKRKLVAFRLTRRGRRVVADYAALRAAVLLPRVPRLPDWDSQLAGARDFIDAMRGIYDQAALLLATHRDTRPE